MNGGNDSCSDNPSGSTHSHYVLQTAKSRRIEKEITMETEVYLYKSKRTFDNALQLFNRLKCFQLMEKWLSIGPFFKYKGPLVLNVRCIPNVIMASNCLMPWICIVALTE